MMDNLKRAIGMDMSELSAILDSGAIKKFMIIGIIIKWGCEQFHILFFISNLNVN